MQEAAGLPMEIKPPAGLWADSGSFATGHTGRDLGLVQGLFDGTRGAAPLQHMPAGQEAFG